MVPSEIPVTPETSHPCSRGVIQRVGVLLPIRRAVFLSTGWYLFAPKNQSSVLSCTRRGTGLEGRRLAERMLRVLG